MSAPMTGLGRPLWDYTGLGGGSEMGAGWGDKSEESK
jgi:hypothetical protein